MSWKEYLDDTVHNNLFVRTLVHLPTIKMVRRIVGAGERVLEAGCGSGRIAMLLADMGYEVTAMDISPALLCRMIPAVRFFTQLRLVQGDIGLVPFKEKVFSVSFSCGVLEHFDPREIVGHLAEQRRVSRYVVVDVPNDKCSIRSFGDERFYSDLEWHRMFNDAGLEVVRTLHRGLDRGAYVGNCSVFLAKDARDGSTLEENRDVYDHYAIDGDGEGQEA